METAVESPSRGSLRCTEYRTSSRFSATRSRWFLDEGLKELFAEISPISDFTGRTMELELAVPGPDGEPGYQFGEPKLARTSAASATRRFAARYASACACASSRGEAEGEIKEQDIFMGDFPLMTENGTFIINGAERVVVSQLVRSPGVYFTVEDDRPAAAALCMGKLIPSRGAWLEFETSEPRRALGEGRPQAQDPGHHAAARAERRVQGSPGQGAATDEEHPGATSSEIDEHRDHHFIQSTLDKDRSSNAEEALLEFYRRLRPGDPPNAGQRRSLLNSLFFSFRRYDLGRVGRYKVNKRLRPRASHNSRAHPDAAAT